MGSEVEVTPIAATVFFGAAAGIVTGGVWSPEPGITAADSLAEFAGRACYQSWDRPNPATRANRDYLSHVLANQDYSIFEHGSVSVYVTGVSRSFSHQMIRHRHISPSQLSQRYVNEYERSAPVVPAAMEGDRVAKLVLFDFYEEALRTYDALADRLMTAGLTRKAARDAARAVLPNCQETRLVLTGNHRAWAEFIGKRYSDRASDEINEFARRMLAILREIAPNTYQNFPDGPDSDPAAGALKAVA
ncbi:FAD-dependent thymidylate synthase [Planomonospora alba]|uniref:Flavin-dependent thymidylate synthase n=1 Tax=Planomonospora alba TaxID=161354 RepID=A0ABP6N9Y8_9ACTN